tara:strand:+ start:2083 stop:3108 length:1026 start_codon:yes stop_codon:yes gene_type:complete
MTPLKFGIIGCSRIAKRSVIPAILKSEFAELEIVGSRDTKKAKEFSNEFDCKKFGNYDDVISDKNVEVIYISTPIGTHEEWVNKAISAGKHVYCEKSSTYNLESAQNMIDNAKQNNVRLMEGFMFRFHSQHKKVLELISDKKIGEIISFNSIFGFPAFPDNDIRYTDKIGGGFLNDCGCYPICASRMIFNDEPISVFYSRQSNDPKTGVDVRGTSIMRYENDKIATLAYGNGNFYQANYEVWGNKGLISLDRAFSVPPEFVTKVNLKYTIANNWNGRREEIFEIKPDNHFLKMIDAFCLDVLGEKKAFFNFEDDLLNQARVMEAHRLSDKSHKEEWISDIT